MGFLKLIFACAHCAPCDFIVSIRKLTFNTNVSACFIWILQTVSAKVTTSIRPSLTPVDKQLYTIIELTTFFHEFFKCNSTNFSTNISQLKIEKKFLIGQKRHFFLSFEHLWKSSQIGLFSKPSGNRKLAPNLCFLS